MWLRECVQAYKRFENIYFAVSTLRPKHIIIFGCSPQKWNICRIRFLLYLYQAVHSTFDGSLENISWWHDLYSAIWTTIKKPLIHSISNRIKIDQHTICWKICNYLTISRMPHFNSIFGMSIRHTKILKILLIETKTKIRNQRKSQSIYMNEQLNQKTNDILPIFEYLWVYGQIGFLICILILNVVVIYRTRSTPLKYSPCIVNMKCVLCSIGVQRLHKQRNLFINRWETAHFVNVSLVAYCDIVLLG